MDGMPDRQLIYFVDPMCSWCWGFAPTVAAIRERFGEALPIRLVMGGLRPGTERAMGEAGWAEIMGHWRHVAEASGQPFEYEGRSEAFVYDTDPAARAVVLMRRMDSARALSFLMRIQQAFYAEGQEVTDTAVLARLAAEFGADEGAFAAGLGDETVKQETWADYGVSQRAGVTGFPTLVGGPNDEGAYGVITRGYQPAAPVLSVLEAWMAPAA